MRNLRWNNRDLVHLDDFFADLYVDHSFPRRLNNTLRQQENDSVDTYNQVNSRQAKGKKRLEHKYLGVTISTSPIIGGSIEYMEKINHQMSLHLTCILLATHKLGSWNNNASHHQTWRFQMDMLTAMNLIQQSPSIGLYLQHTPAQTLRMY